MVPGNLTDVQIHKYLAPLNETKLWRLNLQGIPAAEAFGGFESPHTGMAVRSFFKDLPQEWCCRTPDDAARLKTSLSAPIQMLPGFV